MAKLVSAKCPLCGAPVDVAPLAEQVTCSYCHHVSTIARGPRARAVPQEGPVIHVAPPNRRLYWIFAFVGGVQVLGAVVVALVSGQAAGNASESSLQTALKGLAAHTTVRFEDRPFLFDVNGDGTMDILGKSEAYGKAPWIAAYDGRDGKELWRSAALSKDAQSGFRGLAGDVFVVVDTLGKVQSYRANNGQPAWAAVLGEQARGMCQGDGFVRIRTSDDALHDLSLATGQQLTNVAKAPCRAVATSSSNDGIDYRIVNWGEFRKLGLPALNSIAGMSNHLALVPENGKVSFMLGAKSPGTSVSMIAAVEGNKVLWKTLVPAVDPLTTDVSILSQIASVAGGRIVIPYPLKSSDGIRMAAFDTKSGTRLWDVLVSESSSSPSGIAMTAKDVYFTTRTALFVLRADTGELRFRIGADS